MFPLLDSFSLNDTKLHKINELFIFAFNEIPNLFNSIHQYTMQLITIVEFTHTEFIIV